MAAWLSRFHASRCLALTCSSRAASSVAERLIFNALALASRSLLMLTLVGFFVACVSNRELMRAIFTVFDAHRLCASTVGRKGVGMAINVPTTAGAPAAAPGCGS